VRGRSQGVRALPRGVRREVPEGGLQARRDWGALTVFFDFPAEHWRHLRTTNPIESSFATVKLRTKVTKGAGSKKAALAMACKLLDAAQERWRRINGHELVADLLASVKFKDGIKVSDDDTTTTDDEVAA
jgi:putative transposase